VERTSSVRVSALQFARPIGSSAYRQGVASAMVAGIALGTLGPVSNLAYGAGIGSATFAALRATIGAVAVALFIRWSGQRTVPLRSLGSRDRALLALTAVAQAVLSLTIFAAYGAMSVASVLAVYFCYPLVVASLSIALGRERLTAARALGLGLALAGLLAVLLGGGPGVAVSPVGIALAAVAAICQAVYLVVSRSAYSSLPSEQASGVVLAGGAVLIWLVAAPVEFGAGALAWVTSATAWIAIGIAGIVGAGVAKVCILRAVRRVGGTRTSVLMLAEPLAGVALAAILLHQGLGPWQALGGIGVLAGAVLAQRSAPGRRRSRLADPGLSGARVPDPAIA
jgi:drug/metabolite transporter (DMT)-like permease